MKRFIVIAVVVLILAGLVWANVRRSRNVGVKVKVQKVHRGAVRSTVRAEGEVRARNQVEIGADVMGRIVKIFVQEGDEVQKGDTLCIIDQSTYIVQVNQAKARLQADLARFITAKTNYERTKKLYEDSLVAESAYEQALAEFESMKAQLKADSFSLQAALEQLAKTVIRSPVSGKVLAVNKEEGEMAIVGTINTPGSVIMVVADPSEMLVRAEVDETEVVNVKPGQNAKIRIDAFPDTSFVGVVERIAGAPSQSTSGGLSQTVSYLIDIKIIDPPPGLLPGMSATCDITVADVKDVIVVPITALGRREGRDIVFVVEDGIAREREVELGVSGERMVEVKKGLKEGELIAVGPFEVLKTLKDSTPVKVEFEKERRHAAARPRRKPKESL